MLSTLGFLVLASFTFILFFFSFGETITLKMPVLLIAVHGVVLAALLIEMIKEWLAGSACRNEFKLTREDALNMAAVFAGCMVTFLLRNELGPGAVLASSIVGLAGALLFTRHSVAIYCGSFAGMSCGVMFSSYWLAALAGVIAAVIFVIAKSSFAGFGGKLGTIAFAGCAISGIICSRQFNTAEVVGWETGRLLIAYSVIAAVLTFTLNIRVKLGPVLASAIVGIIFALLMPRLHPETGTLLAVMAFCASFAGMSGNKRIPNEALIAVSGLFCGVIFIFSAPHLGGAGGKLGTIAFGSVMATSALYGLSLAALSRFKNLSRSPTST